MVPAMGRAIFVLVVALVAAACHSSHLAADGTGHPVDEEIHSSSCRTIRHDLGETEICGTPKRIVALDTHSLDLLLALGMEPIGFAEDRRALIGSPQPGESIVGVQYLEGHLANRPAHIGISQSPSLESILILQPDLILGLLWAGTNYPALSSIAPTLLPLAELSQAEWPSRLEILGHAVQRPVQAAAVLAAHERKIRQTKASLAEHQGTSVLLLSMSSLKEMTVFTHDSFAGHLLEAVGLRLLVPSGSERDPSGLVTSVELLPKLQPDIVIVMASGESQVEQIQSLWDTHPMLRLHPAKQAEQVHIVDYQLWSRINGPIAAELVLEEIQDIVVARKS
jgi:iron complex transport system substrate-binding protein